MRITLTRTGGFTGIPLKKTIDTSKLPPEIEKDLRFKIQDLRLNQKKKSPGQSSMVNNNSSINSPDRFAYTITTQEGTVSNMVTLNEKSLNPTTQKLIDYLLTF